MDRWERVCAILHQKDRQPFFKPDDAFCNSIGLSGEDPVFLELMQALGYKPAPQEEGTYIRHRGKNARKIRNALSHRKQYASQKKPDPESPFAVLQTLVTK
jgi:hypothetical protein